MMMMGLMSALGMLQQAVALLTGVPTGVFRKRLEDHLLTGTSGGRGTAMLEEVDCSLIDATQLCPGLIAVLSLDSVMAALSDVLVWSVRL